MFNPDFYPTPPTIIAEMINGINIKGRIFLEPSAGKGDIIEAIQDNGGTAIACEIVPDLRAILQTKCNVIEGDFLTLTSDKISHIHGVIMNPPVSKGAEHILHAYNIAPAGCEIVALCNWETINNPHSSTRKQLAQIIETTGGEVENLGQCFEDSERPTRVEVGIIRIKKSGTNYTEEFSGFFMEDAEEAPTGEGLMKYDAVRDIVNRYVEAVKLFDKQMQDGAKMNQLTRSFYRGAICFRIDMDEQAATRERFKKELQKDAWTYIIEKSNLRKYATKGVREDINKFVETQQKIPFTMKNIYQMFEIIIGTASARMDRAILEAFDTITEHHHDNRQYLKGFKTNSHFLVGKKFILPNVVRPAKEYGYESSTYNYLTSYKSEAIADLEKAICYTIGLNYDEILTLNHSIRQNTYKEFYECEFFKYKAFKNGNMHFEWKNDDVLGKFNQQVSRLKGYPIFEAKAQTKYQKRQTGQKEPEEKVNPSKILYSFKIK